MRKHARRQHERAWTDQCVSAVNACWGRGSGVDSATSRPGSVTNVLDGIHRAVLDMGKPPCDLTPEGAYRKFLGGSSAYSSVRPDPATFSLDAVSWPEVGGSHCDVCSLLPDGDSMRLSNWRDSMLRDPIESAELQKEQGLSRAYCDPELLRSPQVYGRFLQEMHRRGLCDFEASTGDDASLGIFFVKKKDGKQRIIFDTRKINCDFVSPESVALPTSGSLGGIEVDAGETLFMATCDVSTAFYRMLIPESLRALFTLPHVEARFLGTAAGDKKGLLVPRLCVLPIGWSWSLRYCQLIVESFVKAEMGEDRAIKDGETFTRISKGNDAGAAYVDNVLVFSTCRRTADRRLQRIAEALTSAGLLVHEVNMASSQMFLLGLELSHNKLRVSPARAWRVRLALEFAMNKRFISPAGLEIIVGHIVWQFMCRRELLSILSAVYTHIHTEPRTTALPMSDLLCTELRHVIGLLPLCFTNLSAPWSDVVHASDASPFGIGVCYKVLDIAEVSRIGREAERLRYKLAHGRARASAFAEDKAPAPRSLERDSPRSAPSTTPRTRSYSTLSTARAAARRCCMAAAPATRRWRSWEALPQGRGLRLRRRSRAEGGCFSCHSSAPTARPQSWTRRKCSSAGRCWCCGALLPPPALWPRDGRTDLPPVVVLPCCHDWRGGRGEGVMPGR